MSDINKVVLAYSGGLDTSVIVRWLQETYNCEVVTFTADLGQGEEVEPARAKAEALGVREIFIEDLKEEFCQRIRVPHVSCKYDLRRRIPAWYFHCPPTHRQAIGGNR
jgi:Argininosuccinate synthase